MRREAGTKKKKNRRGVQLEDDWEGWWWLLLGGRCVWRWAAGTSERVLLLGAARCCTTSWPLSKGPS